MIQQLFQRKRLWQETRLASAYQVKGDPVITITRDEQDPQTRAQESCPLDKDGAV
jgi:hypothetical protein